MVDPTTLELNLSHYHLTSIAEYQTKFYVCRELPIYTSRELQYRSQFNYKLLTTFNKLIQNYNWISYFSDALSKSVVKIYFVVSSSAKRESVEDSMLLSGTRHHYLIDKMPSAKKALCIMDNLYFPGGRLRCIFYQIYFAEKRSWTRIVERFRSRISQTPIVKCLLIVASTLSNIIKIC